MKSRFILLILALVVLAGCKPRPRKGVFTGDDHLATESAKATPPSTQYPYRGSTTKAFDLIHTELHVAFDWDQEQMQGQATLTMHPWFATTDLLELDAKGFALHKVALLKGDKLTDLGYEYDYEHLFIQLDRPYTRSETLQVRIDYTARPTLLDSLVSEEAAGDQGLYFINPRGETPGKPRQIWTQGESHGSPAWFPTFDTPNQRCTDEIYITVADSFKTLSNGLLVDSKPQPGGLRTDHWKMDLPHAPYLFMMAIGNYAVVKDKWRDREVSYYVEPAYAQYAQMVFGNTPEMIEFFSQKLGVDYPWPKYSQVVVRDFVSGAMENTSATTHYGRLQHNAREHLDDPEEDIISHELFHQWFGDLVTCESWANLSLNEGFATYGEFLWKEYKYGPDEAMKLLLADRNTYLRAAARSQHPIIHYHHKNADAMFDGTSYQKGGQALHMLRKHLGDEAFFAGLQRYLTQHAFGDVELAELRMAFEDVTGQDLNWFFDQWYLQSGHPELDLTHDYADGVYSLRVRQIQDLSTSPVFRLPITLDYVVGHRHQRISAWMETADTTFMFTVKSPPSHVCFDPDKQLLCVLHKVEGMSADAWLHQLEEGQGYAQKREAVEQLVVSAQLIEDRTPIAKLAADPFWGTRLLALAGSDEEETKEVAPVVQAAVKLLDDPVAAVRTAAVRYLGQHLAYLAAPDQAALQQRVAAQLQAGVMDSSYTVSKESLDNYYLLDSSGGKALAERLTQRSENHLVGAIASILRQSNSSQALTYTLQQLQNPAGTLSIKIGLLRSFGEWLDLRNPDDKRQGTEVLMGLTANSPERWMRFFSVQALVELTETEEIKAFMKAQSLKETDNLVLAVMQRYLVEH